jgi:hypothetical protein
MDSIFIGSHLAHMALSCSILLRWSWLPLLVAFWLPLQGAWASVHSPATPHLAAMGDMPCCDSEMDCPDVDGGMTGCDQGGQCERCGDQCGHCVNSAGLFMPPILVCFTGFRAGFCPVQSDSRFPYRYPTPDERPPAIS